jgi:lipopolysaccharide transport system ATP-binding protein
MSETVNGKMGGTHSLTNSSTHLPNKTPIIQVNHLSKRYQIGMDRTYKTFCESFTDTLKSPLKRLKSFSRQEEVFWALKDINFEVFPGEVVGIIGRNGAGKTTLLKLLSRITYPTEGEIRLRGRVASLLEVGTGFHSELTGRENINFNGAILGMTKQEIEDKFDEIVKFSGVDEFLDTPLKRFSSGMQVRLAFSVAAHLEPEILIVDEVLAVGDFEFQKKCLGKMKDVSEGGRTVLFVSHNMAAIRNLCERTILLESGKLALDTDTKSVIASYLNQNLTVGAVTSIKEFDGKIEGKINRNNPSIRLKEVALLDQQGLSRNAFHSDESITVCVTYECLTTVTDLLVIVMIVDEENRPILITQNSDDSNDSCFYQRKPGVYKSSCTIPPNTFGEKRFYVSMQLIYPKTEHLILNKVLGFDVSFTGFGTIQYGTFKDSFIRPQLSWQTQLVDVELEPI